MKVKLDRTGITCWREKNERAVRSESDLFLRIRNALRAQGHDVIKKLMWKDGHLTDEDRYYVRTRRPPFENEQRRDRFAIHDPQYAIRYAHSDFNRERQLRLEVSR